MPDRDPVTDLQTFALPGAELLRPSAAEVRRRGDRMRRRRRAGTVLGAAAAVAVVAASGALLLGPDRGPAPAPAQPAPTVAETGPPVRADTAIPPDFPLQRGWPDPSESGESTGLDGPSPETPSLLDAGLGELAAGCDGTALPAPDPADRTTSRLRQPAEVRARELMTFAGPEQAQTWAASVREVYVGCGPVDDPDLPGTRRVTEVTDVTGHAYGDLVWEARQRFVAGAEPVPGAQLLRVTVLGHAVLLDFGSDEGSDLAAMSAEYLRRAEPVLAAVCRQIAGACPGEGSDPADDPVDALPSFPTTLDRAPASERVGQGDVPDLDLGAGLADMRGDGGELRGPWDHVPGLDRLLVCGEPAVDQARGITGRLAASSSGPETLMYRQVIAYPDASAAQSQMEHLRRLVRGCPRHRLPDGTVDVVWTELEPRTG